MNLKRIAKVVFLFFVSTILSVPTQAQDLVLKLTDSPPTLLKGEEGGFTFVLSNKGKAAVENITVAFTRKGKSLDVVTADPNGTDTFEGKIWNISKLEAGVSTGLTLRLKSNVSYLQFLAEVVSPSNEMAVDRCYNADCYNQNDFYCFYKCDLAADEVRYPAKRATLEVSNMVCALETQSSLPDCGASYNISIQNSSDIPSAPTHIALWAYLKPRASHDYYDRVGNPIAIPSIPAGKSYSLTANFNPCENHKATELYEKTYKALQNLHLIFAEDIGSTANPPLNYKLSNLEFRYKTDYCYTTDIAVRVMGGFSINDDDLINYQVKVSNRGESDANMVQVVYATPEKFGSEYAVQLVSKTSTYANSTFSPDGDGQMRFFDVPQYWNIKDLAAGESATLDVVLKVASKKIATYRLNVYINESVKQFENTNYTDTDLSNNSDGRNFNRFLDSSTKTVDPSIKEKALSLVAESGAGIGWAGEDGERVILKLSNNGMHTVENIKVAFTKNADEFSVLKSVCDGGSFDKDQKIWTIDRLDPTALAAVILLIKRNSPTLQFLAEVTLPENEGAIDRCSHANCGNPDDFYCLYNCELDADEALYPAKPSLEITNMVCAPSASSSPDCSTNYNITIQNTSGTPAGQMYVALWAHLQAQTAAATYQRVGSPVEIPALGAGETHTFVANFGPCQGNVALSDYSSSPLKGVYLIVADNERSTEASGSGHTRALSYFPISYKTDYCYPEGSVSDIDGNTYRTVRIGEQTWMAENLRTTKCSNGKKIPKVAATDWFDYKGMGLSPSDKVEKYGQLYNQYTLNTSTCNVCPKGWRVPSKYDLQALLDYLGPAAVSKWSPAPIGLSPHGKQLTNSSGYWSAASSGSETSKYVLYTHNNKTNIQLLGAKYGFPIRCIKE